MHIHLRLPSSLFPANLPQQDRVCRKGAPERDAALVYVRGELEENRYCIFGVFYPDAHAKAGRRGPCATWLAWPSASGMSIEYLSFAKDCSGLLIPDTDLGENPRH